MLSGWAVIMPDAVSRAFPRQNDSRWVRLGPALVAIPSLVPPSFTTCKRVSAWPAACPRVGEAELGTLGAPCGSVL